MQCSAWYVPRTITQRVDRLPAEDDRPDRIRISIEPDGQVADLTLTLTITQAEQLARGIALALRSDTGRAINGMLDLDIITTLGATDGPQA